MSKGKFRVDAQDLIEALESRNLEGTWFLNLKTGEVHFVSRDEMQGNERLYEDEDRYLSIEPLEATDSLQIMEDFLEELHESEARRSLARALKHTKPFRSFRETLLNFPELDDTWTAYHDDRMFVIAEEWLEENVPDTEMILDRH
jgi:hypothetical protein